MFSVLCFQKKQKTTKKNHPSDPDRCFFLIDPKYLPSPLPRLFHTVCAPAPPFCGLPLRNSVTRGAVAFEAKSHGAIVLSSCSHELCIYLAARRPVFAAKTSAQKHKRRNIKPELFLVASAAHRVKTASVGRHHCVTVESKITPAIAVFLARHRFLTRISLRMIHHSNCVLFCKVVLVGRTPKSRSRVD